MHIFGRCRRRLSLWFCAHRLCGTSHRCWVRGRPSSFFFVCIALCGNVLVSLRVTLPALALPYLAAHRIEFGCGWLVRWSSSVCVVRLLFRKHECRRVAAAAPQACVRRLCELALEIEIFFCRGVGFSGRECRRRCRLVLACSLLAGALSVVVRA